MSLERFIPSFLKRRSADNVENNESPVETNGRVDEARAYIANLLSMDVSEVTDDLIITRDLHADPTALVTPLMFKGFITDVVVISDARKYTIGDLLKEVKKTPTHP